MMLWIFLCIVTVCDGTHIVILITLDICCINRHFASVSRAAGLYRFQWIGSQVLLTLFFSLSRLSSGDCLLLNVNGRTYCGLISLDLHINVQYKTHLLCILQTQIGLFLSAKLNDENLNHLTNKGNTAKECTHRDIDCFFCSEAEPRKVVLLPSSTSLGSSFYRVTMRGRSGGICLVQTILSTFFNQVCSTQQFFTEVYLSDFRA